MTAPTWDEWAHHARRALTEAGLGASEYALRPDRSIKLTGIWPPRLTALAFRLEHAGVHVQVYRAPPRNTAVGHRLTLYPPGSARSIEAVEVSDRSQVPPEDR
jgi:hypothetical protein